MLLQMDEIKVLDRIRKDNGDIHELTESIREYGLMNPLTVVKVNNEYVLIAGFRRYCALQELGETMADVNEIINDDAEDMLRMEYEENVQRKDFTDSEKVAYAEKLRILVAEKARKRMGGHNMPDPDDPSSDKNREMGKTSDIIAPMVGYNNGRQLERATYVSKNRPDLMEKVDAGEMTVGGAYNQARSDARQEKKTWQEALGLGMVDRGNGHKMLGHVGTKGPLSADRYPHIVGSINSAGNYFLIEIRATMELYSEAMMSPEHDEELSEAMLQAFRNAVEAMGDHYKGPKL